jgi:hypothetical protein
MRNRMQHPNGVNWLASRHGRLIPGHGALGTYWIGGWVGPRASLDAVRKRKVSCSCHRSNSNIQPVDHSCTILGYRGSCVSDKHFGLTVIHQRGWRRMKTVGRKDKSRALSWLRPAYTEPVESSKPSYVLFPFFHI